LEALAGALEGEIQARGKEAIPYLIAALKDEEVYLRWRVCYILAGMGGRAREARAALTEALQDSAESVRDGAGEALSRIPKA
jgi:HEAT repeat protein